MTIPARRAAHDRARRLHQLDERLATLFGGYAGPVALWRSAPADEPNPYVGFLHGPEGVEPLQLRGLVTAEGRSAPALHLAPGFSSDPTAMLGLRRRLRADGWLASHQDLSEGGAPRTLAAFAHAGLPAFACAVADDETEAYALAAVQIPDVVGHATGQGFVGLLVTRSLLARVATGEIPAPEALHAVRRSIPGFAPAGEDWLTPLLSLAGGDAAPLVLVSRVDGRPRPPLPLAVPHVGEGYGSVVRAAAAAARAAGCPVGLHLPLAIADLDGEVVLIPYTSEGDRQLRWEDWVAHQEQPVVSACRFCGCTELRACDGRCGWVVIDPKARVGVCDAQPCLEALLAEHPEHLAAMVAEIVEAMEQDFQEGILPPNVRSWADIPADLDDGSYGEETRIELDEAWGARYAYTVRGAAVDRVEAWLQQRPAS